MTPGSIEELVKQDQADHNAQRAQYERFMLRGEAQQAVQRWLNEHMTAGRDSWWRGGRRPKDL